jgi:hypothetical protein
VDAANLKVRRADVMHYTEGQCKAGEARFLTVSGPVRRRSAERAARQPPKQSLGRPTPAISVSVDSSCYGLARRNVLFIMATICRPNMDDCRF